MEFFTSNIFSKLVNPKHLYDALKPGLVLSAAVGLNPVCTTEADGEIKYKVSKVGVLISVFNLIFFLSSFIYVALLTTSERFKSKMPTVTYIGHCLEIVLGVLVIVVVYVYVYRNTSKNIGIVENIIKIDKKFRSIGIRIGYRNLTFLIFSLGCISCVVLIFNGIYFFYLTFNLFGWNGVPIAVTYLQPSVVAATMLHQLAIQVFMVHQRLHLINQLILQIIQDIENTKHLECSPKTRKSLKHRIEPADADRWRRKSFNSTNNKVNSLDFRIKTLLSIHSELSDHISNISNIGSFPYIVILILIFIIRLFTIFLVVKILPIVERYGDIMFQYVVSNAVWAVCFACSNQFVYYTCSHSIYETKRTAKLVHRLLRLNVYPSNKQYLLGFSLQVLQLDLAVSVCDMFAVNYSTAFNEMAATAYYLTILLQFDANTTD